MNKINEKMSLYKIANKKMAKTIGCGIPGRCGCACRYANCGGSSTDNNWEANNSEGWWSKPGGC